jgi:L-ascorbate metabolism protein UlaG (beta-lactamase superfamily)
VKVDAMPTKYGPAPFDGRRFHNASGKKQQTDRLLQWLLTRDRKRWPDHVAAAPASKPVERVDDGSIRATVVGHSTVLLQVAGLNVLTDPVWSRRIGPLRWPGIKRVSPPAFGFGDLPKIDAVLLSHNHYDHLDRPTLAALERRDHPLIVTGLKIGKTVPCTNVVELDWWQSHALTNQIRATYVPAEHFSARGPFDRNASLWGGFVLETPAGTIYFAGDTGAGAHFGAIKERFGPMTLSLLPIGAYEPRWFMAAVHIDPAEAVEASRVLESQVTLPIHFGTFRLADEAFDAPLAALTQALAAAPGGRGFDFRMPAFGEATTVLVGVGNV